MRDKIVVLIKKLKEEFNSPLFIEMDEAKTKQFVITRLLHELGWDIFNIEEVVPEYKVKSQSVDYALKSKGTLKVFLEVKKLKEDLKDHQEQLLGYSFQQGVDLAVLTNGIIWWFYLPREGGEWEERRFCTIDIEKDEPEEIASKFITFLSKENIETDTSIEEAKKLYEKYKREGKIKSNLEKAWNKMLLEPDELLIEAFSKKLRNFAEISRNLK